MKLELGSGYSPTPGFVHLDANPNAPDVDIIGFAYPLPQAALDLAPFDEIRAVDVLEHITYRQAFFAVEEWCEVLAPGGRLYVQVPDADAIMREYVRLTDAGLLWTIDGDGCAPIVGAEWRLLGGHADGSYVAAGDDWRWNAHYSIWSAESLRVALEGCGMAIESLETNAHPNLCVVAVKL